ncbi:hypothetical protein CRV24_008897 [Beauveria bassiana]|uniref:Uncharacterized protein n=2 Tax=Beauveria bassiana TaxID=176275 RepID=J5K062_BEAB2|nr:uncharacterized protein BBA_00812 [Beauveria bassiana ARSEF 2860]EJP69943.1 hypothetical protein BBA_00812 [Beauveria bassiana ARSEF 2860]KAF1730827.1 hypothetical protein CRV24_008897 [Beauveria bassiana]PMB68109.1 hypothetical protein BM221_006286 [Beauveria bassiana]
MMQHPAHGMPAHTAVGYPQQMYYDDFYTGQAIGRRLSRGSAGQRTGTAMRVVKPASANNSPRSAMMAARRRTMMTDGSNSRRQKQVLVYLNTAQNLGPQSQETFTNQGRPLSWHPSSHLLPAQTNFQHTPGTNPLSTPNMYADYQDMYFGVGSHYSPMVESYSTNTSPASTFSPLPAAFPPLENDQYFGADGWGMTQKPGTIYTPTEEGQIISNSLPSSMESGHMQPNNSVDWNNFIMHGFNRTSPPTPEVFLQPPQQQQMSVLERTESLHQVEPEEEDEGEILVGMGLYDTPDKRQEDPQLNNYRSTVTSLLGSTFYHTEPIGKGLKLEETWEPPPPKPDDEDEDEDEGKDAEGEEEAAGAA